MLTNIKNGGSKLENISPFNLAIDTSGIDPAINAQTDTQCETRAPGTQPMWQASIAQ